MKNIDELEFVIFCIENISKELRMDARVVYAKLTEDSNLLTSYVAANYDLLHTQGREYIVNDIVSVMREAGLVDA